MFTGHQSHAEHEQVNGSARVLAPSTEASFRALREEREVLAREYQEIQAWFSERICTSHLNWKQYHREKAEKVARQKQIARRLREIKRESFELDAQLSNRRQLITEFYNGVCELVESGVDIGDRLRDALAAYEAIGGERGTGT